MVSPYTKGKVIEVAPSGQYKIDDVVMKIEDEEGKIIESATTMYQIAEKRVKKIREEDFFRNGAPDDFFVVPKKIDIKKDTVAGKQ